MTQCGSEKPCTNVNEGLHGKALGRGANRDELAGEGRVKRLSKIEGKFLPFVGGGGSLRLASAPGIIENK